MKTLSAVLTITLLFVVALGSVRAQEAEETEEQPAQQMPMTGQMGSGMICPVCGQMIPGGMMMGQMPMMGRGYGMMGQMPMMGGQPGMMGQMPMMGGQSGMMGQMPMMGGQPGMMGQMPMMGRGYGMMGQMPMMGNMMGGQPGMMGMNFPNAQIFLALADELKLTDEQVSSLKGIALNAEKETISKQADVATARVELAALLDGADIDMDQVQQKVRQVTSSEAELRIAQIQAAVDARNVLTDDQRAQLKEIMANRRSNRNQPQMREEEERPMRMHMEMHRQ